MLLPVALSVLVGAFAQRITGMGFALISAPAIVILLGPFDGVIVVNLCAVLASLIILPRVWRQIDWRRFGWLVVPALVGTGVGALVAANAPGPALQFGVGLLVVAALTVSLAVTRTERVSSGPTPAMIAGLASGFMNSTAGVGGPAISVYAIVTRWPQLTFAATAQAYFVVIGTAALVGKLAATGWAVPPLEPGMWPVVIGAVIVGLLLGELAQRHVSHRAARAAVIVIAYVGGLAAMIDGALELLAA